MSEIIHYLTNLAKESNSENIEISEELQLAIQNNDLEFLEKQLGLGTNVCCMILPADDDDQGDDTDDDQDNSEEESILTVNG